MSKEAKADEGVQLHLVGTHSGNEKKLADALKSGKPLFVKLYAEWCGACKNIQPVWNKLATKKGITDAVHLVAIEDDARKILEQDKKYSALMTVEHYPTFFMVSPDGKRGEEIQLGENPLDTMQTFITDYLRTMKGGGRSSRTVKKGKRSSRTKRSTKRSSRTKGKRSSRTVKKGKRSSRKGKRGGSRFMAYTNKLKGHRMSVNNNNNELNELKSQQPSGNYFTKELKQGDAAAKFITISLRGVPTGIDQLTPPLLNDVKAALIQDLNDFFIRDTLLECAGELGCPTKVTPERIDYDPDQHMYKIKLRVECAICTKFHLDLLTTELTTATQRFEYTNEEYDFSVRF